MTLDSVTLSNQPNSRPKHKISSSVEKKCVTNSPFSDGWKPLFCVPLSSEWERDTQTRNRSSRTTWASQRHGVKCWGQHKKRIWRWLWVFVLCVRLTNARRRQQWWQKYSASPWARQCFHYFTIFSHFWLRNSMVAVSFFFRWWINVDWLWCRSSSSKKLLTFDDDAYKATRWCDLFFLGQE